MDPGIALWVLVWVVCGGISYAIASPDRDRALWGVIGFVFGPVGLIVLFLVGSKPQEKKYYPPAGRTPTDRT